MNKTGVSFLIDGVLIFLLAAALIGPLFTVEYGTRWGSIESTFISDARLLKDNWPHANWHPWWYCGTRFDYVQPPLARYATAALAKAGSITAARAYHMVAAFFYCLGIAGVYCLVRGCTFSRVGAWLASAAAMLVSPSWLWLPSLREAAWHWTPQRLDALVRLGEGPHMAALALMGFALWACWKALEQGRPAVMVSAALLCALVVSTDLHGAVALAAFFLIMVWSFWITRLDNRILARAAVIAAASYALCAFWLTKSYFELKLTNLKITPHPEQMWAGWVALGAAIIYVLVTDHWGRGIPRHGWSIFTSGALLVAVLHVVVSRYYHFQGAIESRRFVPEMDLAAILAGVGLLHQLWNATAKWWPEWCKRNAWAARSLAAVLAVAAFATAPVFLRNAWGLYQPEPDYTQRIEYRATRWLAENMPGARVFASGSLRFWFNAWFDNPQVGGGNDMGLLDFVTRPAQWAVLMSHTPEWTVQWLQAMGADAVVVHEAPSREIYKDFLHPRHLDKLLPVAWSSGEGDTIYRVPRKHPGVARVVEATRVERIQPFTPENERETIPAYAAALEDGSTAAASSKWLSSDELLVHAVTGTGQAVTVLVAWDPYWRAYANGQPLGVRKDAMGFMRIEPPAGAHDIRLAYVTPRGNIVGRAVSLMAVLGVLGIWIWEWKRKRTL